MHRVHAQERMDADDVPPHEAAEAFAYLRLLNRRWGGVAALLARLRAWSARWPPGATISMLDVGAGSADIPAAVRAWALRRGFDLRVTAVDRHPEAVRAAREHLATLPEQIRAGVAVEQADALTLTERFSDGAFDYAHAGLFLHHLSDVQALTALRIMDRLARRGVVWNDLVRSRAIAAGVRLSTLPHPSIVRHDAVVSVRAGFTRAEAENMARRVGATYLRWRLSPLLYRFTMAGEKPGAWGP